MATKRNGVSCYEKAGPDEPLFVLRANDKLAAATVRFWAAQATKFGVSLPKINEALEVAGQMESWKKRKLPD